MYVYIYVYVSSCAAMPLKRCRRIPTVCTIKGGGQQEGKWENCLEVDKCVQCLKPSKTWHICTYRLCVSDGLKCCVPVHFRRFCCKNGYIWSVQTWQEMDDIKRPWYRHRSLLRERRIHRSGNELGIANWLIASGRLRTRSTTMMAANGIGRYYAPQSKPAEMFQDAFRC